MSSASPPLLLVASASSTRQPTPLPLLAPSGFLVHPFSLPPVSRWGGGFVYVEFCTGIASGSYRCFFSRPPLCVWLGSSCPLVGVCGSGSRGFCSSPLPASAYAGVCLNGSYPHAGCRFFAGSSSYLLFFVELFLVLLLIVVDFLSSVERVHSTLGGCRSRGFFVR